MRGVVSPLIKLLVFLVVTALATYVLAATIDNSSYGDTTTYKADFTDVSGLQLGDDVRIAGVRVGTVDGIAVERQAGRQSIARVTFSVQKSRPLPASVTAHLRYRNLVGQRYVDIEQGAGTARPLTKPLPITQTFPAVDLTVLFAGFEPLTQGLNGVEINKLSLEIISTLQGEGGAVESLLAHLASLTNALADKDAVIGDVIDNLTDVLTTVGQRDAELSDLIVQLRTFVHGLAVDRTTIGDAVDGINKLATSTAGLLTKVRPPLAEDVKSLTGLVGLLNRNGPTISYVLQQLPPTIAGLIRTASYGSWFNFYLCSISGTLTLGGTTLPLNDLVTTGGSRCT